jgi:Ion channel
MNVSRSHQWGNAVLDLVDRLSAGQLFAAWFVIVVTCGLVYWLTGVLGHPGLEAAETPVGSDLRGLGSAVYFSFVTVTSVGYGDIVPAGPAARILAIVEAVTGLLIFGALVAKFVSRRQDELVRQIHSVTFEERLDRVQTNLHLVLSELQSIAAECDAGMVRPERVSVRLESAALVFSGELRAVHALLYNPRHAPEEQVLEAILISLASALRTLKEVMSCLPSGVSRSPTLHGALGRISGLAAEICGECVPQVYAPALTVWMDQIQETAVKIA